MSDHTIYACSSGPPPAAIAILRISGPAAFQVAADLAGSLPSPRRAGVRALRDPADARLLDRALVLTFPAPRTATGEDLVEFHLHGGRAVVSAVSDVLAAQPGLRAAEPGEFTRRALTNGVIDLTAAEGLGDLLNAQTETQRRAALRMAEGGLRTIVEAWSDRLVGVAARIEAQLDFSDEDDVPDEAMDAITADVAIIAEAMAALLAAPPVEQLHDGVRVVIAGPPNSGKSTLLNVLTGRDVAIVSPLSGTTRDRIEAAVTRDGIAYLLTDTAGLTDTPNDIVEEIGVARAAAAMDSADIVLWLGDTPPSDPSHIAIHARADLPDRSTPPAFTQLVVSAETDRGITALWDLLALRASALLPVADAIATNDRQRSLVRASHQHLTMAGQRDLLIVAEEVRCAIRTLDAVTGRTGTEDILDAIFSRFCIGK
ncbi:tRNA uridine-5-carboxymethylaminomethyl(34) synthesis GTPase MnmE [Sphingomonas glacialis]|uniref:tRNA modification GTPase MnmE n=1 Tax=Sphingomonas glacialis TaxID=658225 RepID=A0A502FTF8_9SPHN|nr:tRNA uridine-5-carboxymethylaminomethyl(34) synthesis GTPase MnmE [Sphingomonas glacialis]TPG52734.1 tRNA uridine-5-carboxymethylaminomethyl(34) synthesis GTPase MnmE [Sphingomonas glacialis]